ncbi:unnamed protein product, partial [Staurois parvus]
DPVPDPVPAVVPIDSEPAVVPDDAVPAGEPNDLMPGEPQCLLSYLVTRNARCRARRSNARDDSVPAVLPDDSVPAVSAS